MNSLLEGLRKWQVKKSWKVERMRVTYRSSDEIAAIASVFQDAGLVVEEDSASGVTQAATWEQALLQYARCEKNGLLVAMARDSRGCVIGAAVGTGGQVFEIDEVAVLADSREQGVGTELVRALESLARVSGAHTCHAYVPEGDLESQLFFKAAGYAVPRKRSGIIEVEGTTHYVFVRSLGEPDDFAGRDDN